MLSLNSSVIWISTPTPWLFELYRCHVLHHLLEPSQRKLFSRLEILVVSSSHDNPRPIFFNLRRIFNASPHIATYVRHLAVTFDKPCAETSFVIAFLKKLSSVLSLQIRHGLWDLYAMGYPQWPQFVSTILHPSLQRLDLWRDAVLPKAVWQFPALRLIKLGTWKIENIDSDEGLSSLTRCLAMSWSNDDPLGILSSFLRISPLLIYLKVSESLNRRPTRYSHNSAVNLLHTTTV